MPPAGRGCWAAQLAGHAEFLEQRLQVLGGAADHSPLQDTEGYFTPLHGVLAS